MKKYSFHVKQAFFGGTKKATYNLGVETEIWGRAILVVSTREFDCLRVAFILFCLSALSRGTSDSDSFIFQGILPEEVSRSVSVCQRLIGHKELQKNCCFSLPRTAVPSQGLVPRFRYHTPVKDNVKDI
ncbi:MAG: hypothetical protein JWL88_716 [Parcubacteria group bacterium]|nr:hypothetical protein [Parcubacteria group bacterium]